MAKNTIRQKKKPMSLRHQEPKGSQVFFSFGGGWVVGFCSSQCVPMKFSMCCHEFPMGSQHIPQVSNCSSLYSISFALSSALLTYITNPKEEITTYLFWDCSKLVQFLFL